MLLLLFLVLWRIIVCSTLGILQRMRHFWEGEKRMYEILPDLSGMLIVAVVNAKKFAGNTYASHLIEELYIAALSKSVITITVILYKYE